MYRLPPILTRTVTLFPCPTRFRCLEAVRAWREVAQAQADQFDGRSGGNEDRELLFKSLAARPPCGLARAVLNLTCRMPACRQRRGGPQTDIFFVAQVQSFALGVADGVVAPGREPVLTAVGRPGDPQSAFGHDRTEGVVGENIRPGRRSGGAGLQTDDIVSAIGSKTTPAIIELQIGRPRQRRGGMYRCRAIDGGERRPLVAWLLLAGELIADRPAALVEDHPRNPIEERRAFAIAGPDTDHVDATVRPEAILGVLVSEHLKKLLAHRLDIA